MKKFLYLSIAAAAMAGMTACSSDESGFTPEGKGVTFSVKLPSEMGTRAAFGDGLQAEKLNYAVYDPDGKFIFQGETEFNNSLSTTVCVDLATGSDYKIAFFAHQNDGAYTFNAEDGTFSANYDNMKNSYNTSDHDAFFKLETITNVQAGQTHSISLTRPVAQLNWGTSDLNAATVTAASAYGENAANLTSKVSLKGVYTTFDMLEGKVSGESQTIEFEAMARPVSTETLTVPGFPVEGYEYVSLQYILVPDGPSVIDAVLTPMKSGIAQTQVTVSNCPVQANYRTNIYGALLTTPTDFSVLKEADFAIPDYIGGTVYGSEEDLENVLNNGGTLIFDKAVSETIDLSEANGTEPVALVINAPVENIKLGGTQPVTITVAKDVKYPTLIMNEDVNNLALIGDPASGETMTAFHPNKNVNNVIIEGIKFKGGEDGNWGGMVGNHYGAEFKNITVKNCVFENITSHAIGSFGEKQYAENILIEGCYISISSEAKSHNGFNFPQDGNKNITVRNNTVVNNCSKGHGMLINGNNVTVTENNVTSLRDAIKIDGGNNRLASGNITVSKNITKSGENGIRVKNPSADATINIEGNSIDMSEAKAYTEKENEPWGIYIYDANNADLGALLIVKNNVKVGEYTNWFQAANATNANNDIDNPWK